MEAEAGGALAGGGVPGAGAWILAGFGPQLAWDTRDGVFFPRSGSFVELGLAWYPVWTGGDAGARQLKLNARRYLGLGASQVLAFQGGFDFAWGDLPFAYLPSLGGSNVLRGYYQGRHRDQAMAAAQAEYRFPVWKRLGGAAFAGLGKVGPDPASLGGERLRSAGGGGLRVRLNREGVNLRCDLAFDREAEASMYITFMEAF